jgi:hypothetical protein
MADSLSRCRRPTESRAGRRTLDACASSQTAEANRKTQSITSHGLLLAPLGTHSHQPRVRTQPGNSSGLLARGRMRTYTPATVGKACGLDGPGTPAGSGTGRLGLLVLHPVQLLETANYMVVPSGSGPSPANVT